MPPASLVNILALGLVGVVTAGLYLLFSNTSNNQYQQNYENPNSQRPRRPQRRYSNSREKNICLCLEDSKPTNCSLRNCGHYFHKDCLKTWADERPQPSCPFCREDFIFRLDVKDL